VRAKLQTVERDLRLQSLGMPDEIRREAQPHTVSEQIQMSRGRDKICRHEGMVWGLHAMNGGGADWVCELLSVAHGGGTSAQLGLSNPKEVGEQVWEEPSAPLISRSHLAQAVQARSLASK